MSKKLTLTRDQYSKIKEIIGQSSCLAVAYNRVAEVYNLDRDNSRRITEAVRNNYKYLKVID